MRIFLYILLVSLLITPAYASDWNMFKKDLSHSGYTTDPVSPPLVLKWNTSLGFETDSSPVIVNDVLYIGSNYGIHAIDVRTGKELWRTRTNGFVKSVPVVLDGVLYIGPDERRFYALDTRDGSKKWEFTDVFQGFTTSAFVTNDIVYIGSKDGSFFALRMADGNLSWKTDTGKVIESSAIMDSGTIAFGTNGGYVIGLDASNGKSKWIYKAGFSDFSSSPAIAEGIMFIGSDDGRVYALTASNGTLLWKFSTGNNVESSPSIRNGIVYVGSQDSHFYAIDAKTGSQKWSFSADGYVDSSPAISNDIVYFGSRNNYVYALDANTGSLLWINRTGDNAKDYITSPAISGNMMFAATHSGYVYAYSSGIEPTATPLPPTATPTAIETTATPSVTPTPTRTALPAETKKTPGFEFSVVILLIALLARKKYR